MKHNIRRFTNQITIITVKVYNCTCYMNVMLKLEGHSVERMYLRQRCFDSSLAQ